MNGTLIGVGVGPGDPGLITVKALETIARADIVAAPDSGGDSAALDILGNRLDGKTVVRYELPMTRDADTLDKYHEKCAAGICDYLKQGKTVAFLTLGDPSIYSTYCYIHKKVLGRGFDASFIPGVTSFCAAAAALNSPLCEKGEPLHIIPAAYGGLQDALAYGGNKVFMKAGKEIPQLKAAIESCGVKHSAMMVERCGMAGQRLAMSLDEIDGAGYFCIVVVKEDK
ncbi:precorrin-2 C(20)-methyltransferase [Clostridia bacterium]|nr:precorrin-2 C(20)-methyltransferase [Clostridia bacterium]